MSDPSAAEPAPLQVSVEEENAVVRTLVVELDAARVDAAFEKAYRELRRRARVRGFRPGKAPREVLHKLYGASVAEELEGTLVAESLPEALEQSGLEPMTRPSVDAPTPTPGSSFRYTARVEVKPRFELPALTGLPARKPKVEVGVADVETELEALRQRHASLVEEPEGTAAALGHVLTVDFEGRIDDQPFEGGSGTYVEVEIGSDRFLPGFEDQLLGARSGDRREVRVTFPEDHSSELAGKQAVFQVRVGAVKRREVPELDDEFAKDLGELKSLAELRVKIREGLEAVREREARRALERSLLDVLLERTPFEVPPGLVLGRLERRLAQAHRELSATLPAESLQAQLAAWRDEWRPHAERELREELVLEAVARERGIEVADDEVEERLTALAGGRAQEVARLRKAYEEDGLLEALRASLARAKALDFLVAEAKVEETTGT